MQKIVACLEGVMFVIESGAVSRILDKKPEFVKAAKIFSNRRGVTFADIVSDETTDAGPFSVEMVA